jgi:hypothetical protein
VDDRRHAREVGDFTREPTLSVNDDRLKFVAGIVDNLDLTGPDDEEFENPVADCNESVTVPVASGQELGALARLFYLSVVENREGDGMKSELCHVYF